MEKLTFPILIYSVRSSYLIGQAVGFQEQWIHHDLELLRKEMGSDLRLKMGQQHPPQAPDIRQARLKTLRLSLRPTQYLEAGTQVSPDALPIPIPLVFGKNKQQEWVGYAPWFLEYPCRSTSQKAMEKGVLGEIDFSIQDWSLPRLLKLTQLPGPELDFLEIRVNASSKKADFIPFTNEKRRLLDQWGEEEPLAISWYEPGQAWQREEEVRELESLLQKKQGGIVVVGENGSGKSLLIRQALRQLNPRDRKNFPAWRILSRRLPAGVQYLGEWQGLVEDLVAALQEERGILWLEDPAGALQAGGETPESSVAGYLQLFLEDKALQLVMETSPAEWEQIQQQLPSLAQQLHPIHLRELGVNSIRMILDAYAQQLSRSARIRISQPALEEAYRLTHRFLPQEQFPGKAMRLLIQCIRQARAEGRKRVDRTHLIRQFASQTGLPELFLRDDLQLDGDRLQAYFEQRILGQPEAIKQLCEVVKVFKTGLNNPQKPITSLLFAGPTGVGKTASAEALASFFFGEKARDRMIRLDMSELQYPDQIDRLIGSIYHESSGHLAGKVREQPFSLVLLDEIEKATPIVFDTLLNILDEGLLVDSFGRLTYFRNSIIIMTTNLGAQAPSPIGFSGGAQADRYRKALKGHFRPEFINRIDGFVFFHPLQPEHLVHITRRELDNLGLRSGIRNRNLQLEYDEQLVFFLARGGYHEKYGARPLQRFIERYVTTPLAEWLLDHADIASTTVKVSLDSRETVSFAAL